MKKLILGLILVIMIGCTNVDKSIITYDGANYIQASDNFIFHYYDTRYPTIRPVYKNNNETFTAKLCVEDKVIKKEQVVLSTLFGKGQKNTYYYNENLGILNIDQKDEIESIDLRIRDDHFIMNSGYNDYKSYGEEYVYEVTLETEEEKTFFYEFIEDENNICDLDIKTNKQKTGSIFRNFHYFLNQITNDTVDVGEVKLKFYEFDYLYYIQYIVVYDRANDCYYLIDQDHRKDTIILKSDFLDKLKKIDE